MKIVVDTEFVCDVPTCKGYGTWGKCGKENHSTDINRSRLTDIIWAYKESGEIQVFVDQAPFKQFKAFLNSGIKPQWICQTKIDIKQLKAKGFNIDIDDYYFDTCYAAHQLPIDDRPDADFIHTYNRVYKKVGKKVDLPKVENQKANSLGVLASYFCGAPLDMKAKDKDSREYKESDGYYTYRLYEVLEKKLKKYGSFDWYHNFLMPATRMLLRSELKGVRLDRDQMEEYGHVYSKIASKAETRLREVWKAPIARLVKQQQDKIKKEYVDKLHVQIEKVKKAGKDSPEKLDSLNTKYNGLYEKRIIKETNDGKIGLNLNSSAQLKYIMGDVLGYNLISTEWDKETQQEVTKESTDATTRQKLIWAGCEDVKFLDRYKEAHKLDDFFTSYSKKMFKGRIFGNFNITGTRTGRLSASQPNLQQVPADIKDIFIPDDGYKFVSWDLSAIEPTFLAYRSQDPMLCSLVLKGISTHDYLTRQALSMFWGIRTEICTIKSEYAKERALFKAIGLALFYCAGWKRLMKMGANHAIEISPEQAKAFVKWVKEEFEGVFEYRATLIEQIERTGYVQNMFGRPLYIDPADAFMKGLNTEIQSTASDWLIKAALRLDSYLTSGTDYARLLYVHDELLSQVREDQAPRFSKAVEESLTDLRLDTKWGTISPRAEGGILEYGWSK